MPSLLSIIVSVAVFVVGQVIRRFLLEPLQEQRRVIGEIAGAILLFGNIGPLPPDVPPESLALAATHSVRGLEPIGSKSSATSAARLRATLWSIPLYRVWSGIGAVHSRAKILGASQQLVSWSNSVHNGPPGS
jgi:hypothetical protein